MKIFKLSTLFVLSLLLCAFAVSAQKMKPEDILSKHLESIGTSAARAAVKSQIAVGDITVQYITRKNQTAQGRAVFASSGAKNFFGMNLNAADYTMDRFSFDGSKSKASYVRAGTRSVLGNFLLSNDVILKESLLGGTLATSWALFDVESRKAKLSFDGTKKINGKETYVLSYSPKAGDVSIKLYFDKETFRHVRTEYKRTFSAAIGLTPNDSAKYDEGRLTVTEDFSDFKKEKDLTLPHGYRLNYSIIGQNGTNEIEWKVNLTEFAFNQTLDEKTFDAEAN
ncbi:MAG TPA: hypothetical protein VGC76_15460 [Pyrinomonadaceae bacterium]|jgi:outer membrane lipoprotein-sorting protein